jgi:hypothetical protein
MAALAVVLSVIGLVFWGGEDFLIGFDFLAALVGILAPYLQN